MAGDIEVSERVIAMRQRVGQFSIKDMLNQPDVKPVPQAPAAPPEVPPPLPAEESRTEPAADATLPSPEELPTLPGPGDAYKAYARTSNKPLPTLVVLRADASARGFSYGNLDTIDLLPADKPGQGPEIVLRFAGIKDTEIRIAGRHLDRLYSYVGFHRVGWIRELSPSREFLPDGETVITAITFKKVEG